MKHLKTLFIADLHLCQQQPEITRRFINFCREQASQADKLYILGDLFEYWLGDDAIDDFPKFMEGAEDEGVIDVGEVRVVVL